MNIERLARPPDVCIRCGARLDHEQEDLDRCPSLDCCCDAGPLRADDALCSIERLRRERNEARATVLARDRGEEFILRAEIERLRGEHHTTVNGDLRALLAAAQFERDKARDEIERLREGREICIVFDGPPGPEAGRFIEVETPCGRSIRVGRWREREDGLWSLDIRAALRGEGGEDEENKLHRVVLSNQPRAESKHQYPVAPQITVVMADGEIHEAILSGEDIDGNQVTETCQFQIMTGNSNEDDDETV